MKVEWFHSGRGRRGAHARVDGEWVCRYARGAATSLVVPAGRTSLGHVVGEVCAYCAIEVNARAVLARDEARRESV